MRTKLVLICLAFFVTRIAAGGADSQDKLYSAIRANDLRQIKALLDEGVERKRRRTRWNHAFDGRRRNRFAGCHEDADRAARRRQREEHVRIHRSDVVGHRREEGSSAARSWRRRQRRGAKRTYGSDRCVVCESVCGSRAHATRQGRERCRHGSAKGHAAERSDVRQRHRRQSGCCSTRPPTSTQPTPSLD